MPDRSSRARVLVESLSPEELDVLRCLVAGESQAVIAFRIGRGPDEALAVRQSLLRKLGANSTADAVREGIYAGL